jgi:hypothetical protein
MARLLRLLNGFLLQLKFTIPRSTFKPTVRCGLETQTPSREVKRKFSFTFNCLQRRTFWAPLKRKSHGELKAGPPRVEAGQNTSTVALRVVRGDEKGTQSQMRR